REVGEALGEVDGAVQVREPRHLADHGLRETARLGRSARAHEGGAPGGAGEATAGGGPGAAAAGGASPGAGDAGTSAEATSRVMSAGSGRLRSTWPASVSAGRSSTRICTRLMAGKFTVREFTIE